MSEINANSSDKNLSEVEDVPHPQAKEKGVRNVFKK